MIELIESKFFSFLTQKRYNTTKKQNQIIEQKLLKQFRKKSINE